MPAAPLLINNFLWPFFVFNDFPFQDFHQVIKRYKRNNTRLVMFLFIDLICCVYITKATQNCLVINNLPTRVSHAAGLSASLDFNVFSGRESIVCALFILCIGTSIMFFISILKKFKILK